MALLTEGHNPLLETAIEEHGGRVVKTVGDAGSREWRADCGGVLWCRLGCSWWQPGRDFGSEAIKAWPCNQFDSQGQPRIPAPHLTSRGSPPGQGQPMPE